MAKLKTGRHTSALKAQRQSETRRWKNARAKSDVRDLTKEFRAAVTAKDSAKSKTLLPKIMSAYHSLGRRNILHPSTAARKISRLSSALGKLG